MQWFDRWGTISRRISGLVEAARIFAGISEPHGRDPEAAIVSAIRAGGDTDSNAANVGAWVGALHGELGLPKRLWPR